MSRPTRPYHFDCPRKILPIPFQVPLLTQGAKSERGRPRARRRNHFTFVKHSAQVALLEAGLESIGNREVPSLRGFCQEREPEGTRGPHSSPSICFDQGFYRY